MSNEPVARRGRPFEKLPAGAREHLLGMAQTEGLNEAKAARSLGMPLRDFQRVVRDNEASAAIYAEARAVERDVLLDKLWHAATVDNDVKAAQWLLSARHGINDKGNGADAQAPNITINLPSSMTAKDYARLVEASSPRLSDDSGG